jgi:serine/threonine protein kinase
VAKPKTPDRIGQVISQRYEIVDVIGRGGQGLVYRAADSWTRRDVAIKVLGSKAAREPQMVERLMREQQALYALKGTAAVELLDVCRGLDGELCLVMELLVGTDLDDHLYGLEQRGERLELSRVAEIFDPIVSTLETAHDAGILHRDLKPANIFLLESGDVRLLDFGMARLKNAAPLTAAGTIMGSPSFMAPEAWRGLSDLVDQRADVYSLGVILFRVLAGDLPFGGDTLKEKFVSTTTSRRPSLHKLRPDLPREVDEWVELALALDREQRFANVRALWSAFLRAVRVAPPRKVPKPSLWTAAKDVVKKLASPSQPAAASSEARSDDPSFTRQALAPSAFEVNPPVIPGVAPPPPAKGERRLPAPPPAGRAKAPRPDATIELRDEDLALLGSPKKPPPRRVEKTMIVDDADLLADGDTLRDASAPPTTPPPPPRERSKEPKTRG